jgi:hypothetical protein
MSVLQYATEVHPADVHPGLQRLVLRHRADAGVGHHHVKLTEGGNAVLHRPLDSARITDVRLDGQHPAVERLDLLGGLRQVPGARHRVTDRVE